MGGGPFDQTLGLSLVNPSGGSLTGGGGGKRTKTEVENKIKPRKKGCYQRGIWIIPTRGRGSDPKLASRKSLRDMTSENSLLVVGGGGVVGWGGGLFPQTKTLQAKSQDWGGSRHG